MMKKQFFRVKQLADQTIFKADKSEVLNCVELQNADQKIEFLRHSLTAIHKRIPSAQNNDEKRAKRCLEQSLSSAFKELYYKSADASGFTDGGQCKLFIEVLKECEGIESALAKNFLDQEQKIEELVSQEIQNVLDNEFPGIAKHKRNLTKYILDKDSANNRYNNSTRKEALQDDKDEAESKVEQTRDIFAYEMFNVLARENDFAGHLLQILKCQRGYHEVALKTLEELIPVLEKKIGESDVRCIYGTALEHHLKVTNNRLALPLQICISWLSGPALFEEGLFRIAGSSSRIKRFKSSIDSGCFTCHSPPDYIDNHIVASALKLYLRELPDPLLTFKLHNEWIQSMQVGDADAKLHTVKRLIERLPPAHKDNLNYLMRFLAKLALQCADNKMNSSNIAIVMSPNLLWHHDDKAMNMVNCAAVNNLVEYFIKNADALFEEDLSGFNRIHFAFNEPNHAKRVSVSTESLNFNHMGTDSPKQVRKKKAAPIPPTPPSTRGEHEDAEKGTNARLGISSPNSSMGASYPSGSSTLNRPHKQKSSSIATSTDDHHYHPKPPSADPKPNLVSTSMAPIQLAKAKPVQPLLAQNTNITSPPPPDPPYTTIKTHHVPPFEKSRPVAAPRSVDIDRRPLSRNSSMRDADVVLRKPEIPSKPELLPRPASIGAKRGSADALDAERLQRTQCSVYSTANVQQASYVSVANHRPGHDHLLKEKERFLGHRPEGLVLHLDDVINSNNGTVRKGKSNENLMDMMEASQLNGNQRGGHVRTKSLDGNLAEKCEGVPSSPRSLTKPTEAPPPPPVIVKKPPDSTDL